MCPQPARPSHLTARALSARRLDGTSSYNYKGKNGLSQRGVLIIFKSTLNLYRRVSSRGRRAQVRFSRGARGKKKGKRPSAILALQRKYTDFRARFPHSSYVGMPSWEWCLRCAIAVEVGRKRAATASIYRYNYNYNYCTCSL